MSSIEKPISLSNSISILYNTPPSDNALLDEDNFVNNIAADAVSTIIGGNIAIQEIYYHGEYTSDFTCKR